MDNQAAEPAEKLQLARKHLEKVQAARNHPTDWADLYIYGLYALETSIQGAAGKLGIPWQPNHPSQVRVAEQLRDDHGLPDIVELLVNLQRNRLSEAYGDIEPSRNFGAEDIAASVEEFVEAVGNLIEHD